MTKLKVAIKAAKQAGKIMLKDKDTFKAKKKGIRDIVTNADFECEKQIIKTIKKHYPKDNILSEETRNKTKIHENLWIIDPVDGTGNYSRKIPNYCCSIAFYNKNQIQLGIVYNPITEELYSAERNKGAKLNGKKIHVSKVKKLTESYISPPIWKGGQIKVIDEIINKTMGIREFGSCALELCYVASGKIEAKITNHNPWDVTAGCLIIEEAGGKITSYNGKKYDIFNKKLIASNGLIHNQLIKIVKKGEVDKSG